MMNITRTRSDRLRLLLPVMVISLALAACGGSSALSSVGAPIQGDGEGGAYPAATLAPAAAPDDNGNSGYERVNGDTPPLSAPLEVNRKIVYTGSLELVVADLPAALAKAKTAVLAIGGYVGASAERNDDNYQVATITYRIPAARWDETVDQLRALADKVVGGETRATEVGDQIVDLEARLRNLRASEQVLLEIAEGTGKISDLLEVQARISDVRGEIERIDAQRAHLEDQAAFGTLVVTFGTEVVQVQQTAKGWDPAEDVDAAMATLIAAGQALVSAAIWFGIVWLPVIIALVILALVARRAFRRLWPRPTPAEPISGWGTGEGGQA